MKTTIFVEAGKVEAREAPKPVIKADDDVILRVVRACVCGSDLWSYRGQDGKSNNSENTGHEAIGIVEEAGPAVTSVKPGGFRDCTVHPRLRALCCMPCRFRC